jgi:hypothetical protein
MQCVYCLLYDNVWFELAADVSDTHGGSSRSCSFESSSLGDMVGT